jgi:phenylalanyl-tRNA synthetase beta chain
MLVSWDWLKEYVTLDMTVADLADRLMMAGLNHDGTTAVGQDWAINLEVTSNRPDCLGHLGIAREVAVLWNRTLRAPAADPRTSGPGVAGLAAVAIDCPDLCPRYTARVIRGVKIGPSPAWLRNRLAAIGIAAINNVVDITNYVLMECGQPLHAFDLQKLSNRQIVVRRARSGEVLEAINHKNYTLDADMCVIADARRPVALAGVMGGAETEVTGATRDVLIESAAFAPMTIRSTARRLNLHSDSSYRFERGLDPQGVDWASRRCCELILQIAGGELAEGMLDVGAPPAARQPITLRFNQLRRILGIDVPPAEAQRILTALGCREVVAAGGQVIVVPPTWRGDLTREIDLVEEVARIHGYDKIPEDVRVPMAPSHRTREDRVLAKVRQVLTAAGYDEALTLSAVEETWSDAFSPWTSQPPLRAQAPVLRRADRLRRSLVPSLLGARQTNEALSNPVIELFEVAKVYLSSAESGHPAAGAASLPVEETMITIVGGSDYFGVKGVCEALLAILDPAAELAVRPTAQPLLETDRSSELWLAVAGAGEQLLGYLGEVNVGGRKEFDLRGPATVAEIKLSVLLEIAQLIPQAGRLSAYPAVSRDLNLVVDEAVFWADVAQTVRQASTPYAEHLQLQDVYRSAERLGPGKKSLLLTLTLRSAEGTLTGEEADAIREKIVAACAERHGAQLRTN